MRPLYSATEQSRREAARKESLRAPPSTLRRIDPLDDLPPSSRAEVVAAVCAAWEVGVAGAEDVLRASEPFWNALEEHHGVDSWGGGEFCRVFPAVLTFIRKLAKP